MKLPVFKAFGATFAFVFGNLGDVIRITWLPLLALSASTVWFFQAFLPTLVQMIDRQGRMEPEEVMALMGPLALPCLVLFVVSLIFYPMLYAGLLRFLVRGERPGGLFYLQFGADELRMVGTYIVILLINIGIGVVSAAIDGVVALSLGGLGEPAAQLTNSVIQVVIQVVSIWIALRLSLSFAAAIGKRQIGVGPSWTLAKGNVWRLLGFFILIGIAFVILYSLLAVPFVAQLAPLWQDLIAAGDNETRAQKVVLDALESLANWMRSGSSTVWLVLAVGFVVGLISTAITIAAGGVAYRLMTEDPRESEA